MLTAFMAMWRDRESSLLETIAVLLLLAGLDGCAHAPRLDSPAVPASGGFPAPASVTASGQTPEPKPPAEITLVAGGDVTPAHRLKPWLEKYGPDYPYRLIAPYFQAADIGLVNLECPLSASGRLLPGKKFTFCGDPAAAQALKRAGITAVTLANNHILDCGAQGLEDTISALQAAQIFFAGAGMNLAAARRAARMTLASGLTIGLLAYSLTYPEAFYATSSQAGTAPGAAAYILSDVAAARAESDIVVVYFHWSGELVSFPRDYQQTLAHTAIQAGARLILGAHPHVLQGIEWFQDGLIFYSLGNLAFGGGISRQAKDGAVVKIIFRADGNIKAAYLLPVSVDNAVTHFLPTPLTGPAAFAVCSRLQKLSAAWGTTIAGADQGWCTIQPSERPDPGDVTGP